MRRMQIYLDEKVYETLRTESKARKTTISNLIRIALMERYAPNFHNAGIIGELCGIWKDHNELDGIANPGEEQHG